MAGVLDTVLPTGLTVGETLEMAKNELCKLIEDKIITYYSSYSPERYKRTHRLKQIMKGVSLTGLSVVGNHAQMTLPYNIEQASHPSLSGKRHVDVAILMNFGTSDTGIYDHDPQLFFDKAVEEFNERNKYGVYADMTPIINNKDNWEL